MSNKKLKAKNWGNFRKNGKFWPCCLTFFMFLMLSDAFWEPYFAKKILGGLRPPSSRPGALPLDPAGGCAPRPPWWFESLGGCTASLAMLNPTRSQDRGVSARYARRHGEMTITWRKIMNGM